MAVSKVSHLPAIKEALSDWLNLLYDLDVHPESFKSKLETGEVLLKHANCMRAKALDLLECRKVPLPFTLPKKELPVRCGAEPGTWLARDNVHNFISFCRTIGVNQCILFETEDLVNGRNEKNVLFTLLEVARRGAAVGLPVPKLTIQLQQELDGDLPMNESEDEVQLEQESGEVISSDTQLQLNDLHLDQSEDEVISSPHESKNQEAERNITPKGIKTKSSNKPLKSPWTVVKKTELECRCSTPFKIVPVSTGTYRVVGHYNKVSFFARTVGNQVMVRVGGGWETLEDFFDKHDPCGEKIDLISPNGQARLTPRSAGKAQPSQPALRRAVCDPSFVESEDEGYTSFQSPLNKKEVASTPVPDKRPVEKRRSRIPLPTFYNK